MPLTLASHLTDSTVSAFTKQPVRRGVGLQVQPIELTPAQGPRFTGPVAILTSDATVSAAEVGTLAFRALPNTRSFGRPTYGALSDPFRFRLPNGWKGAVSNEIYRASDGNVYEGTGIPPTSSPPSLRRRISGDRWRPKSGMPKHGCWQAECGKGASSDEERCSPRRRQSPA